jgi:hypothetical protein
MDNKINVVTCVYCGKEYPQGTPTHGENVKLLTDHVKICHKHPMRKVEADKKLLRDALAGLVGASTKKELEQMELAVRRLPDQNFDKSVSINAIHALLATLIPEGGEKSGINNEQLDKSDFELVSDIQEAISMLQDHIDEYHDCDVPENTEGPRERRALQQIIYHLMGSITPTDDNSQWDKECE